MQRNRLKVEEKELDFIFEVANVQFNQLGKYVLVLTVENPLKNESGTGLKLRINDGDVHQASSGQTDAISQNNLDEVCTCMCNKFVFTLPKGYCKNDKNHDVRLKVEALRVLNSDEKDGVKSGEGFFAIYPRTNAPRINLYAGQEEELYQYSGIMALLRVHDDHLSMHCGRLVYSVAFHEARPFLKEGGRSSRLSSLLAGVPPEAVPSFGTSTLQVPTLSLGLSQRHSALVSRSEDLTTAEDLNISLVPSPPTSPNISQNSPKHEPETQMYFSNDSLPSTPRSGVSSDPEPSSQTPKPGDLLQDKPAQTPEPLQYKHVIESPCDGDQSVASDLLMSNPGMESITFILHGATSLPPLSDGGVPQPYAIVKSAADEDHGRRSQGVTSCTLQPTHSPSWEEKISVELPEQQQTCGDVVVLNVADSRTKEILAHYRLPVRHLQPFHHYHLELVQTHSSIPHGVNLYVTVVRKLSTLPRQPHFTFTGFEVLLQAMETPLKEPVGPLCSVARIVPDYHSYRDAMLLHTPRAAGVTVTTVHSPQAPESAFSPALLSAHGRPQVSLAASPEQQPVWNHSFLFLERDCATMFSGDAALVLEFYPTTSVLHAASWHLRNPVGFSALSLHPALYRKLMSERGQRGVRVGQLPLRGSNLRTTMDSTPSVSIVLRLIGSERPDSLLTAEEPGLIPSLDPETLDEDDWIPASEAVLPPQTDQEQGTITIQTPPSPEQPTRPQHPSLQRDGYSLPSYDALAQILPDYQHLFSSDKPPAPGQVHQQQDRPSNAAEAPQNTKTGQRLPDFEDDPHIAQITELQTKEVENYRTAMRKMAEDIITLRSQVVGLESDNSQLRSDLSLHQDLGRNLLDDTDIDVMTKTEIADRIASLKFKLASETSKSSSQRDKIQQLQNDLIRKNDTEKELVRLQRAHQQQQEALQSYQSRVAKLGVLETTVRHQEKVIEKMEKVLDNKLTEKNKDNSDRELSERRTKTMWKKSTGEDGNIKAEIESALAAENCRLRGELERLRQQQAPIIIQQPPQEAFPDKEKLSLLGRLEKADSRVQALETQLKENSKRWGRQKQEMLTRLSEQNCGFARTSTTILHDFPLKSVSDSLMNWRRHRQPKPKK